MELHFSPFALVRTVYSWYLPPNSHEAMTAFLETKATRRNARRNSSTPKKSFTLANNEPFCEAKKGLWEAEKKFTRLQKWLGRRFDSS